jgi:ribosomal protein L1
VGKKRIKTIDLAAEEAKKPKEKKRSLVKSGKQHGRITDMGTVMLEEMEKRKKEAKKEKKTATKKVEKKIVQKKKVSRPKRRRSQRYQALRKLVKSGQTYPLPRAIELLKKTAQAQFEETVELHLIMIETGKLTKTLKTEKKFPLAHLKIGKTNWTKKKLTDEIKALLKKIDIHKVKKAVLTSTMGPGIKIDLESL